MIHLVCDYPGLSLLSFSFYFRPTPAIEPEILRTMVVRHFIGYAPNPGNRKRNQVIFCACTFIYFFYWSLNALVWCGMRIWILLTVCHSFPSVSSENLVLHQNNVQLLMFFLVRVTCLFYKYRYLQKISDIRITDV